MVACSFKLPKMVLLHRHVTRHYCWHVPANTGWWYEHICIQTIKCWSSGKIALFL